MDLNFTSDYILENDKVLLRPLQLTEFQNLVTFSVHEPELWKYSGQTAAGPDKLIQYLQSAVDGRTQLREYPFIVFDKARQQYAGSTRFYAIQTEHQTLELGYTWYGKDFQGTGINKQCKYLLLEFAFEKLGAVRVEFKADNENKRSIAAMKSIGCKEEGVLRSHLRRPDGTRRDSMVLSILKDEWENEVKFLLLEKINKQLQLQ
jgi:N-acetyltransferase